MDVPLCVKGELVHRKQKEEKTWKPIGTFLSLTFGDGDSVHWGQKSESEGRGLASEARAPSPTQHKWVVSKWPYYQLLPLPRAPASMTIPSTCKR